jgi:3-hydroxyisobutyrate dehydrogenase-like beta-hydroxyacid dehydrogenase
VSEEPALASNAKLMANYTIVASLELMGEVYAWAAKVGVDRDFVKTLLDAVLAGPALRAYNQKVAERSFEPGGFALEGGLKDVELMLGAAGEVHVPLPFASVLRDRLLVAMARDMGDLDWSALTEIARDIAPVD